MFFYGGRTKTEELSVERIRLLAFLGSKKAGAIYFLCR
jgi:hypothetical protein